MQMDRKLAHAPRVEALWDELTQMRVPCIGCEGCAGVCAALIELMSVPDAITRGRP